MTRRFIREIDEAATDGELTPLEFALKKIINYIHVHYDDTFPENEFMKWANSSTEKPLRHNRVLYYWDKKDVPVRDRR